MGSLMRPGSAVLALCVFWAAPLGAEPAIEVVLRCPATASLGRIRCDLEVVAPAGARLSWADAVLREASPSVTPLRARLAPADAVEARPERYTWAFAIVAKERATVDLALQVRAVLCRGDGCVPVRADATARMRVE